MSKHDRLLVIVLFFSSIAGCGDDSPLPTRVRSDADTRTVHGRATLYDGNGDSAGCADDGTQVTMDGNYFRVADQKWPGKTKLSDGNSVAAWIHLPDASTCDGQPNPPQGHFIIGAKAIVPPQGPPMIDRDTDRLRIRGLAIGGDAACTHGALDLDDVGQAGDDIAVVASGVGVGWTQAGGGDLTATMSCAITMNVGAQPGYYIQSFHGILTGGLSLGGDADHAMGGRASASARASGSVGDVAIAPLAASASSAIDADMGLANIPLASPATTETAFLPAAADQCAPGGALVAVTLDVGVDVARDNDWLTPLASFDAYDFAFLTAPCP